MTSTLRFPILALMKSGEPSPAPAVPSSRTSAPAILIYNRCGHRRSAATGPTRVLDELCRDCLKARGRFKPPAWLDLTPDALVLKSLSAGRRR